jgi:predicted SPOUT superfamily RNA methylase MTH1
MTTVKEEYPPRRKPKVSVAVPASLVSDVPHLREKTLRIGLVGRALAIFRVDEVIIFPDILGKNQTRDAGLISIILSYMETPQYLRKQLFKIKPELRYCGILPPLRTPHHPLRNKTRDLKDGEYRDGALVSVDGKGARVDVGVEHSIMVPNADAAAGVRVTVRLNRKHADFKAEIVSRGTVPYYWGYKVETSKASFGNIARDSQYDLVIATSRLGEDFQQVADVLRNKWDSSKHILVAFGAPSKGLHEIVKQEGLELSKLTDFIVNTVPRQATETIRTEEALYATLAILNLLMLGQ